MRSEVVRFSVNKSDSNLFIEGDLVIPNNPMGIIVFVHGSGSGKGSYRNQTVSKN
jgi:putative phosphoribosyl transferase